MAAINPAKILSQRSHIVAGRIKITEHFFEVPLNYSYPSAGTLHLFARSARRHNVTADRNEESATSTSSASPGNSVTSSLNSSSTSPAPSQPQQPWLLFLQGGPGFPCASPQNVPFNSNFLDKGYQMLFLDPRGTGLSSPISASTLGLRGDERVQAAYLKHFRADSIVRDAEAIRLALTQYEKDERKRRWSVIGQSFGGFCIVHYLSTYPNSLRDAFIFGGLPPLVDGPDDVYKRLFKKVVERNQVYYEKYPEDIERVKLIVRFLMKQKVNTPNGGILTPRAFLQLGIAFGGHGGIDSVHETVLKAWSEIETVGFLTAQTLATIEASQSWNYNPIYAILHEPIYCQGTASNWSAERVMREKYRGFDPENTLDRTTQPTYFTGEMMFPFSFDGANPELTKMKGAADILASDASWPALYDRKQLANNTVPVYAAVYMDDMYVDFNFSLETASAIKGCKTFVTNVMFHNAIRAKMDQVVEEVWKLRCDTFD